MGIRITSSRWQVLGTIVAAAHPQPVAWLARDMGANRQNVLRIVNDLERDEFVELVPNPHHRRASLVVLTKRGKHAFDQAMDLEAPWMNDLSQKIHIQDIQAMHRVLAALKVKFDNDQPGSIEV